MNIIETWIGGEKVFTNGEVLFNYSPGKAVNNFNCSEVNTEDLKVRNKGGNIRVIEAFEGELLTKEIHCPAGSDEYLLPDPDHDVLKIVVKDRYHDAPPIVGFIKGFGLREGAFASSVAHDSHNIIAVGTNDNDIITSINTIVSLKGGLAAASGIETKSIQLDIGGIMSTRSCDNMADDYNMLNELVKSYGCTMKAPFMTLSFMALLVIPDLKIGDRGLFDVKKFELVSLFV
jgi:adenine deaminase